MRFDLIAYEIRFRAVEIRGNSPELRIPQPRGNPKFFIQEVDNQIHEFQKTCMSPGALEEVTARLVFAVLGTNFFHRVVGFGCFPYGGSINQDPSYTMFDNMDAGHVLLSFGFELARGLQF